MYLALAPAAETEKRDRLFVRERAFPTRLPGALHLVRGMEHAPPRPAPISRAAAPEQSHTAYVV